MKRTLKLSIALLLVGCSSLTTAQQSSLTTLAQNATNALIASAPSATMASNFASGATVALRSLEGSLVTPATVQQAVASFSPSSGTVQWAQLAVNLASAYATANPKTPTAASAALEALAGGLDAATVKTSP